MSIKKKTVYILLTNMTTALSSLIQHQQIAVQNKSGILELKFSITEINF